MSAGPVPWLDIAGVVCAVPAFASSAYLAGLSAVSSHGTPPLPDRSVRFDIIVPAHNESGGIAATVASLLAMDYPREMFRVLVIADNCTDDTAARAAAAGATVIVRSHETEKGKGYALAHAYRLSLAEGFAEAVVVVDADTSVSANLLGALAARFRNGAEVLQAEYGVRNATESWRTRLMVIALSAFHTVRSLGRNRLGLSCGLRGNGMAFSTDTLRRVPPRAFSIVEDVEYGIALGLNGIRVVYVPEAEVRGDMPASEKASRTQRTRWEGGRLAMIREHVPALWAASRRGGGRVPLDLAADLLVPPLATILGMVVAGLGVWGVAAATGAAGMTGVALWIAALACLCLHVARGAVVSKVGPRAFLDLLWAPVYAVWKLTLLVRPNRRRGEWVRTMRTDENI